MSHRNLTGFGVRVYPTGGKVYIAQARGPSGSGRGVVRGWAPGLAAERLNALTTHAGHLTCHP